MRLSSVCPDANSLEAYLLGRTPDELAAAVEAHLASCTECRRRLTAVRAEDAFVADFRLQARIAQPTSARLEKLMSHLHEIADVLPAATGPWYRHAPLWLVA